MTGNTQVDMTQVRASVQANILTQQRDAANNALTSICVEHEVLKVQLQQAQAALTSLQQTCDDLRAQLAAATVPKLSVEVDAAVMATPEAPVPPSGA